MSDESHKLIEVLPDLEGPTIDAYLVYPEELRHSKRIAVVRDFLLGQAAEENPEHADALSLERVGAK